MNKIEEHILIANIRKCLHCNDTIQSKHRRDFVTCKCGKLSIDGGTDACSRVIGDMKNSEFKGVYSDDPHVRVRDALLRGSYGKSGNNPIRWFKLSEMTEDHIKAVLDYWFEEPLLLNVTYTKIYENELLYREVDNG